MDWGELDDMGLTLRARLWLPPRNKHRLLDAKQRGNYTRIINGKLEHFVGLRPKRWIAAAVTAARDTCTRLAEECTQPDGTVNLNQLQTRLDETINAARDTSEKLKTPKP